MHFLHGSLFDRKCAGKEINESFPKIRLKSTKPYITFKNISLTSIFVSNKKICDGCIVRISDRLPRKNIQVQALYATRTGFVVYIRLLDVKKTSGFPCLLKIKALLSWKLERPSQSLIRVINLL